MDDSRGQRILDDLVEALEDNHKQACLNDAVTVLVDLVDNGIGDGIPARDLNHLDSARLHMNRAVDLLKAADQLIGNAKAHVTLAVADNVIELYPATPDGAA